jgi:murein L,D-transpeptidase YcbB/YkuD
MAWWLRKTKNWDLKLIINKILAQNAIYLHDTPAKSLFNREDRAFSHGCIRVEKPVELATQILKW